MALRKQMNGIFCVLHQRMKRFQRVHFIRHCISRSRKVGSDCLQILWVLPRPISEPFHIPAEPKNCKPSQDRNLNAGHSCLHGREGPAISSVCGTFFFWEKVGFLTQHSQVAHLSHTYTRGRASFFGYHISSTALSYPFR